VLFFNVKAVAEDVLLSGLTMTYTGSTGMSNILEEVVLFQGTKELYTLDSEDIEDLNLASGSEFALTGLNQKINRDQTLPFTLRVAVKNGEVGNLGQKFGFILDATTTPDVRRNVEKTVVATNKTTANVTGREYSIVTTMPTITVAKDNEYILVTVNNTSEYDIDLNQFDIRITNNVI